MRILMLPTHTLTITHLPTHVNVQVFFDAPWHTLTCPLAPLLLGQYAKYAFSRQRAYIYRDCRLQRQLAFYINNINMPACMCTPLRMLHVRHVHAPTKPPLLNPHSQ